MGGCPELPRFLARPCCGPSTTSRSIFLAAHSFLGLFFFLIPLIGWLVQRGSRRAARLGPFEFQPCVALPAPPLPHPLTGPLSDTAGFRPSPLLSPPSLSRLFPILPAQGRLILLSSSHGGPVRAGPVIGPAGRTPAGRSTGRRPGLRWDVAAGDVFSPPGVPPGPPDTGAKLWSTGVLGGACAYGRNPRSHKYGPCYCGAFGAVWSRTREARGSSACEASYTHLSYGQPADDACASLLF